MKESVSIEEYLALQQKYESLLEKQKEEYESLLERVKQKYRHLWEKIKQKNDLLLKETRQEYESILEKLEAKYSALLHEHKNLKGSVYGNKRNRFVSTPPEQLALFDTDVAKEKRENEEEEKETITYTRRKKKRHPGREKLPENLPIREVIIEPQEDVSGMKLIGYETTDCVDYKPGELFITRYKRPKYAVVKQEEETDQEISRIVIAEMPSRPIPKGIAEAGLLAHLLVSKYIDHLPFYRQIQMFNRMYKWVLSKSTLNDWFNKTCALLAPLYEELKKCVLLSDYLQVDESPIKVQDRQKIGTTHQGYMWGYRNPLNGLVLFNYRRGRGKHGPREILADFEGYLQCDGYAVYESLAKKRPHWQLVSCLAHIRRKFFEAKDHHPALAEYALLEIQKLYKIERQCRDDGLSAKQIKEKRRRHAKPIFEALLSWVKEQQAANLSKGPIGKALLYAKKQLPLLEIYLDDGRIQIDNNLMENAIRPLALGRKNYLFAGSHQAAQRAAMMYSFFASCKTLNINPWEWLKDVLQRISDHPVNQLEELLPHNWKSSEK